MTYKVKDSKYNFSCKHPSEKLYYWLGQIRCSGCGARCTPPN